METCIDLVDIVKSVKSVSRIIHKSENILKNIYVFFYFILVLSIVRFQANVRNTNPKLIIGCVDNPIPLIINFGSQPLSPLNAGQGRPLPKRQRDSK